MNDNRNFQRGYGRQQNRSNMPAARIDHSAMTQYYDAQGLLRREVFIDWPQNLARELGDSRTSLRRLFDHVSALRFRIKMKMEDATSVLQPGMGQLYRFAEYQANRVIKRNTKEFIQAHCKAVGSDQKKFEGFYQLFQSVMAYLGR